MKILIANSNQTVASSHLIKIKITFQVDVLSAQNKIKLE